jgi:hypothetical protein
VTPTTKNALLEAMMGTARRGLLDDGHEVVKRGGTAPVVEYSDGTAGLGVPQGLMDVWDGARNALTNPNYFDFLSYQSGNDYHEQGMSRAVRDSFDAATAATTGSMLATRPIGSIGMGGRIKGGRVSASEYDAAGYHPHGAADQFAYQVGDTGINIYGQKIGDRMLIDWIGTPDGEKANLGVNEVRSILRQLGQSHKGLREIGGERVSGARQDRRMTSIRVGE